MALSWYVLRSKPRKEDTVYRQIKTHGFDVYYPRMRVSPVNKRSRKVKPYFPGYMFVNVDLDQMGLSTFKWMPHTLGLVCFGDEPAIVPEHLINELQSKVGKILDFEFEGQNEYKTGDQIVVKNGLFRGYEAIFDQRISGSERVRVLLMINVKLR
jgi:transcription antitermination factor NusG